MRILVTGKDGQLGRSIQKLIANTEQTDDFVFTSRKELDLASRDSITCYFDSNDKFDIIINCAAYTAVDRAEEEPDLANQINHLAVRQIAKIASDKKTKLIHVSTDYVFDGEVDIPYIETDETKPINVYGKTKLAGERAIQELMSTNGIIIRTSWVYSEYGNNFVKTMLKIGFNQGEVCVVNDQIGSPTYAADLADAILKIVGQKKFLDQEFTTTIYHYSNKGRISWCDFAREIFNISKAPCKVLPVKTEHYRTLANRPKSTVMSQDKIIKDMGLIVFNWKDSLRACIKRALQQYDC